MKSVNILKTVLLATTIISLSACKDRDNEKTQTQQSQDSQPTLDNYSFQEAGIYPEGIDFDTKNNRFVISSFNKGAVYTLGGDGKNFSKLIDDNKLVAALGVYTDEANDRIIVVSGDAGASEKSGANASTAGQIAYAGIYNAKTGTLIKSVDLKPLVQTGGVFSNDITVDKDANIYITDSFSPIIYKIDKAYNASVFVNNDSFSAPAGSFGLNGIVYHNSGFLIVAHTQSAKLFKVNIADASVSEVTGLNNEIKTPDGLEWSGENLVVIENGLSDGKAFLLSSNDNWKTASVSKSSTIGKNEFPTTAFAAKNGTIYVLSSYLGKLLSGDKTQADYQIKAIKF